MQGVMIPQMMMNRRTSRFLSSSSQKDWRATTILGIRKGNQVVLIGDGQVTSGHTVVKGNAKKIRRLGANKDILAGFAGVTADALALMELLETKLEEYQGQLLRSSVELTKLWRMDKRYRALNAQMIVADKSQLLLIAGNGDVLESNDGLMAIGSGGDFALASARALIDSPLSAEEIARKFMEIAANLCIYTNNNFLMEKIDLQ
eukprot:TRINITY_DN2766_c0_g1_i1.p1 TRINITY_DN2766_c0_g1~~TRINITY_DN2766_c0_g1_i1.p1  ORF type:complete len:226 (-),score=64.41 TRINITY_DN2766_c0_g1_i1:157-768(-)